MGDMDIVVKQHKGKDDSHIYIFVDRSDETNLLIENVTTVAKNKEEVENKHKTSAKKEEQRNKNGNKTPAKEEESPTKMETKS